MNNEDKILSLLENLTSKFDSLESQVKENTQILKALEHKVDIIKAEQENIKHDVANISGSTIAMKKDIELISKDLNFVEVATGKNITDIAHLKSVK